MFVSRTSFITEASSRCKLCFVQAFNISLIFVSHMATSKFPAKVRDSCATVARNRARAREGARRLRDSCAKLSRRIREGARRLRDSCAKPFDSVCYMS